MRFRVVALETADFAAWVDRQKAPARTVLATDPVQEGTPVDYPDAATSPLKTAGFFPSDTRSLSERVVAERMAEWKSRQAPVPAGEIPALVAQGRETFKKLGCIGCHTVRGHEGGGLTAPDLTHFAGRTTIAAAMLDNNSENLRRWVKTPHLIKPGNLMWIGYSEDAKKMTDEQADALVAYLQSLR
jgi:cytochrome c oxidase subunit 2